MILLNTTYSMEYSLAEEWLQWVENYYLTLFDETDLFAEKKVFRLISESPENGATYAIQLFLNSMEDYLTYQKYHEQKLKKVFETKFGQRIPGFSTILKQELP